MPQKDESFLPMPTPEQREQIEVLMHRVQTGVAFIMQNAQATGIREPSTEPKHLRVGINAALCEHSALVRLLFRKKLINAAEYYDTLIEVWTQEVDNYQRVVKTVDGRLSI